MKLKRRDFLASGVRAGMAAGAGAAGMTTLGTFGPAIAQSKTKVKLGYLHTPAVDGQIWTGIENGSFAKQGIEFEPIQFVTGLELFQAMIGGSLDMLSTGAVVSNFPARGQGKVFLINNVEFATAQLWVREDQGVKSFADLKGRKISTTTGTTAHVFLDSALRANKLDPARDVQIINQRMAEAVTSFVSGAVPAVALWVPFDVTVRSKVPEAKKLVDASAYYPEAAIVGGWVARNDYFEKNRSTLVNVIKGWSEANDRLLGADAGAAIAALQSKHYPQVEASAFAEQFKASKYFTSAQWRKMHEDGTTTRWLQQVTDFFVTAGGIQNPVPASQYFDPKLYLETVKA
ncbi:MAG: ABC transporter substrate-binding protein [Lautropia sp.]|nr:ABC transporter substrate-binding protein [Lautropia sp.]